MELKASFWHKGKKSMDNGFVKISKGKDKYSVLLTKGILWKLLSQYNKLDRMTAFK